MTEGEQEARFKDLCIDLRDAAKKYKEDIERLNEEFIENRDVPVTEAAIQEIGEDLRASIRTVIDLLLELRSETTDEDLQARIDHRMAHVPKYAYQEVPDGGQ